MTEEHKLIMTIIPKFEMGAISEAANSVISGQTSTRSNAGGPQSNASSQSMSGSDSGDEDQSSSPSESKAVSSAKSDKLWSRFSSKFSDLFHWKSSKSKEDDEDDEKENSRKAELKKKILTTSIAGATRGIKSVMTASLGFVQDIYKRMKESSPLLQAIETMFNLAVRLFFMPLGNKLAELMIPAVLKLVDDVTKIWDSFEGQTLGQMLSYAISEGVKIFGTYITSIGEELKDEKGIVGAIGRFLVKFGDFVENKLEGLINTILSTAGLIMDHFVEFVSLYVGLQAALIGAVIGGSSLIGGPLTAGAGAAAGFALGFSSTELIGRGLFGFAEGGHVSAKAGGHLAVVGEGGEGEWIIPDSKMSAIGGNTTINYYINGYTDSELRSIIRDSVDEQISRSRISSSF